MIRFTLRNPDGLFLNTDYHSRGKYGDWREEPRLYKSLSGIKAALGYWTPPCIEERVGLPLPCPAGRWTTEDREANRKFWKEFRKIKQAEFFKILEDAGYILTKQELSL